MYRAPLTELQFVLFELLQSQELSALPGCTEYSPDLAEAILGEAARFAETVLEPLNRPGDESGARWTEHGVVTAPGFREAYQQFCAGGWPQLGTAPEFGGQAMPQVLVTAVQEIWASANLAFKLCPMLTLGAVHALELCGTQEQKARFLPKMISGEWTGTMNLTESHAGSDLGLIRTRAVPEGDHYRLFGQKIFITWGDHDYTSNIVHMVLGRIEGAPAGVRGISLFIVPKFLLNSDGSPGEHNEVRCVSIEHKLGIHASPTCVLAYGDQQGAVAYLVGEPNRGLEYMFIMMNAARLSVGLEGYAIGERAYQQALEWARNRMQGKAPGAHAQGPVSILHHPDIKRMLLTMKSLTEAGRALAMYASMQLDLSHHHPDAARRASAQRRAELLIPIVKGWCTEQGNEVADLGVQVHGGMGFIEETGAAQYVRDVRITTIYEGTTGIQSNDLLGRKLGRDQGAAMNELLAEARGELEERESQHAAVRASIAAGNEGLGLLQSCTAALVEALGSRSEAALAVSVPYLMLSGYVLGGWLLARSAAIAAGKIAAPDSAFYGSKLQTARFYAEQVLPRAHGLARIVHDGAASVLEADATLI